MPTRYIMTFSKYGGSDIGVDECRCMCGSSWMLVVLLGPAPPTAAAR
jgi:hypothetical protein